jgi:hypothetical protein
MGKLKPAPRVPAIRRVDESPKPSVERPINVSGETGWMPRGLEGDTKGILRKGLTELSLEVKYEGQYWTGILRASSTGYFSGTLSDRSGGAEPAKVSGFLYQNTSRKNEWLFFGKWLEGNTDD